MCVPSCVASGGAGQVYSDTTNPSCCLRATRIALASQAGAALADMEFYTSSIPPPFPWPVLPAFCSQRLCAERAHHLRNDRGERFMERYHPLLELAPRDVVARAITRESMGAEPGRRAVRCAPRHAPRERSRPHKALSRHQRLSCRNMRSTCKPT